MNAKNLTLRIGIEYKDDAEKITAIDTKFSMQEVEQALLTPELMLSQKFTDIYCKLEKHIDNNPSLTGGRKENHGK